MTISPFDALVVAGGIAGFSAFAATYFARRTFPPRSNGGEGEKPPPDDPDYSRGLLRPLKVRPPIRLRPDREDDGRKPS
jgi:hypothetical protein